MIKLGKICYWRALLSVTVVSSLLIENLSLLIDISSIYLWMESFLNGRAFKILEGFWRITATITVSNTGHMTVSATGWTREGFRELFLEIFCIFFFCYLKKKSLFLAVFGLSCCMWYLHCGTQPSLCLWLVCGLSCPVVCGLLVSGSEVQLNPTSLHSKVDS